MSSPPRPTAITDSAFNCFDDLHLEDQEGNLNPFAESSSPQHHPGQKSFKIGTRGRSGGLTMEDALGPFRRGIEEDNQFFDMDTDDPFKSFGQHMEDEGGRYEVKEEAFVEVMSADDEGEDDDELLDEDDLDGEDIDEVSSHKSTVASKTPVVRRRLKRKAALKKAPGAPKRFKSPYILFSIECRESIKRQLPPQAKVTEIMSKIAETWRNLTPEERKHWQDKAERDRQRYDSEMSSYQGPLKVPRVRPRRNPEQPKRATSAFMQFSRSVKPQMRMEHTEMSNADITKMLTERWKGASKEEKLPFLEKEREDRAVYKKAMENWQEDVGRKAKADGAAAAAAAAATAVAAGAGGGGGLREGQEGLDEMELRVSEEGITTTAMVTSRRTGLKVVSSVPPPPPAAEAEAAPVMKNLCSPPLMTVTQAYVPPTTTTASLPYQQLQHQNQHQPQAQQQRQQQQQQQQHRHQQEARQQQERQHQQQQHLLQQQQLHQQQQREKREQQREQQQEREEQAAQYRDDSLLTEYLSAAQESFKLYDNFTRGIQAESASAAALSFHKMEDDSCYASSSCSSAYQDMLLPVSIPAGRKSPVLSRASSVSAPSLDAGFTTAGKGEEALDHLQYRQGSSKREHSSKISPWLIPMLSRSPVGSPLHSPGELSVSSTSSFADSHHSGPNGGQGNGSESEGQRFKLRAAQEMLGQDRPHHSSMCVAAAAASSDSGTSSHGEAARGDNDRKLIQNTNSPTNYYIATPAYKQQLSYHHQKQQQQQQQQQQPHQRKTFSREEQNLLGLPPSTPSSPPYLPSSFLPAPLDIVSMSRQTASLPADGKNNYDLCSRSSSCPPHNPQHPPSNVVTTVAPGEGVSQTTYLPLMTEWPPTASSLAVARGAIVDPSASARAKGTISSCNGVQGMGDGTEVYAVR